MTLLKLYTVTWRYGLPHPQGGHGPHETVRVMAASSLEQVMRLIEKQAVRKIHGEPASVEMRGEVVVPDAGD